MKNGAKSQILAFENLHRHRKSLGNRRKRHTGVQGPLPIAQRSSLRKLDRNPATRNHRNHSDGRPGSCKFSNPQKCKFSNNLRFCTGKQQNLKKSAKSFPLVSRKYVPPKVFRSHGTAARGFPGKIFFLKSAFEILHFQNCPPLGI